MIQFTVKDNKVQDSIKLREQFGMLKDWKYVIKEDKEKRTDPQNKYLRWWVYKAIADHTGYDDKYIHAIMGMQFLVDRSRKLPYVKSTTELTTAEMVEYIENIKNFMAEYGVIIPSAEEYDKFISNQ